MKGKQIPLTKGFYATVDEADYPALSKFNWQVLESGGLRYAVRRASLFSNTPKKIQLMHRDIMKPAKGMSIDHINHDGLDNRRSNLRASTVSQNNANSRPRTKRPESGYPGVRPTKGKKWMVRMSVNGENKYLGTYVKPGIAALAYRRAHRRAFGEFSIYQDKEFDNPPYTIKFTGKELHSMMDAFVRGVPPGKCDKVEKSLLDKIVKLGFAIEKIPA